jgi:hypothetical protein
MRTLRLQNLMAIALAWGLTFTSTNLFAQQDASARVPVGPPVPSWSQPFAVPNGPLPSVRPQVPNPRRAVVVGQSYDGIDFLGSNCGCLPPDTNAAVGGNFVVETVNVQLRVFDKTLGTILLDEPLSTFFGAASGGDPYVVYDDIANRWYVSAFDTSDTGLFLAVSNDANPLDGFKTYDLTNVGGFPDYNKMGYNKNAIFISFNNFGPGGGAAATIASIDKAAILGGTLTYYVSVPNFQFRAMPPAQMHGDKRGSVEYFVSTDGTDAGGNTIRVTYMTNYLSNAPTFAYKSLPVNAYVNSSRADQPGGSITTFPNTTTTQVHFRNGLLVTAMDSATAKDGFVYPKGLVYRITFNPVKVQEFLIDPGPGVAVQLPSVDVDNKNHFAVTWMESSNTEYLSMWVGNHGGNRVAVAPGGGFMFDNFRIGDYSTIVIDPSDLMTFWAANEYIGSDGATDIWRTHIASFTTQF